MYMSFLVNALVVTLYPMVNFHIFVAMYCMYQVTVGAMWGGVCTYSAEAFPTEIRNTAAGVAQFWGRLSGALLPIFVGVLLDISMTLALSAVGAAFLLGAVFSFFIPTETAGLKLR